MSFFNVRSYSRLQNLDHLIYVSECKTFPSTLLLSLFICGPTSWGVTLSHIYAFQIELSNLFRMERACPEANPVLVMCQPKFGKKYSVYLMIMAVLP